MSKVHAIKYLRECFPKIALNEALRIVGGVQDELARPSPDEPEKPPEVAGLSPRDHFAAAALTGLLAQSPDGRPASVFAKEAYICADAMMKAREAKP